MTYKFYTYNTKWPNFYWRISISNPENCLEDIYSLLPSWTYFDLAAWSEQFGTNAYILIFIDYITNLLNFVFIDFVFPINIIKQRSRTENFFPLADRNLAQILPDFFVAVDFKNTLPITIFMSRWRLKIFGY